jgi:hypothetical protein
VVGFPLYCARCPLRGLCCQVFLVTFSELGSRARARERHSLSCLAIKVPAGDISEQLPGRLSGRERFLLANQGMPQRGATLFRYGGR